ncbi:MAG TPA: lysylphosphatidylglycerol synthase transmembrane domain-containing protein, partial [Candidatus Limnocylindrales bacterium]
MSDAPPPLAATDPATPLATDTAAPPEQLSLARRLRDPRTIVSIVLPIVLLVLIALNLRELDFDVLLSTIVSASPLLLGGAFVIYYLGFPLRGYRWQLLLRSAGTRISVRDSTEIIFISWLVNCLVPAKLGDVYRAWLLRANFIVSLSRTFGTVFIERVFDLFAIAILGLAAAFWSFRGGLPAEVQVVIGIGLAVLLALAIGLYTVRNFGRRSLLRLPLPGKERLLEYYDRFEQGVFSINPRQVPLLALLTALIWATEAMRLLLVIEALDFR